MYLNTHLTRGGEPLRMWEESKQLYTENSNGLHFFFFFFGRAGRQGVLPWLMTSIPGVLHSALCLCSCTAWTTHLTPNLTQNSFFQNRNPPYLMFSGLLSWITAAYTYTKCQYSIHDSLSSVIILNIYHTYLNCF